MARMQTSTITCTTRDESCGPNYGRCSSWSLRLVGELKLRTIDRLFASPQVNGLSNAAGRGSLRLECGVRLGQYRHWPGRQGPPGPLAIQKPETMISSHQVLLYGIGGCESLELRSNRSVWHNQPSK